MAVEEEEELFGNNIITMDHLIIRDIILAQDGRGHVAFRVVSTAMRYACDRRCHFLKVICYACLANLRLLPKRSWHNTCLLTPTDIQAIDINFREMRQCEFEAGDQFTSRSWIQWFGLFISGTNPNISPLRPTRLFPFDQYTDDLAGVLFMGPAAVRQGLDGPRDHRVRWRMRLQSRTGIEQSN